MAIVDISDPDHMYSVSGGLHGIACGVEVNTNANLSPLDRLVSKMASKREGFEPREGFQSALEALDIDSLVG